MIKCRASPAFKVNQPLRGSGGSCARLSHVFPAPFAQICAATSAYQNVQTRCSQGPNIIPLRNVSTGTPVSPLSAQVNVSCFCAESTGQVSCLTDVVMDSICRHEVDGQEHRHSAASKKTGWHSEGLSERHTGLHSETVLIPFRKSIAALVWTFRQLFVCFTCFGPVYSVVL